MTTRRLTTLYIKALTATWILVIVPLTMGAYSCTAYQRRSERYLSTGVTARNGLLRGRHASIDNAQGASSGSDQGTLSHEDVRGVALTTHRDGSGPEVPSDQLWEVTQYSHLCTLPTHGHDKIARRAANGRWPIADVTIAADPSIPFGTELLIEGLGFRTVGDRGSAIKGRKIDVFVDSCREAKAFGRQWLKVYPVPSGTTRQAGLEISNE